MRISRKCLTRVTIGLFLVGSMTLMITACSGSQMPKSKIQADDIQEGTVQIDEIQKEDNREISKEVRGEQIEQVTEEELYTAFKDTIQSVANNPIYMNQIPSAITRDFDGDGLLELLLLTTDSDTDKLFMQVYEYELGTKACYLSEEMEFGIGSSADGEVYYNLYENEKEDYLISVYNGKGFGDSHTMIAYKKGELKTYTYRNHSVARGWSEEKEEDIYRDVHTYEIDDKECTKEEYEKAIKDYKEILSIAHTTYGTNLLIDKTEGAKDIVMRYNELTNNQESIYVEGSKFLKEGKLNISHEDMGDFMEMTMDELEEVLGEYEVIRETSIYYAFKQHGVSVVSHEGIDIAYILFYGESKILDLYFPEHESSIVKKIGQPNDKYYNGHDDENALVYLIDDLEYTLSLDVETDCLNHIMVSKIIH